MAGGKNLCNVCKKSVTKYGAAGMECEECKLLFHYDKCANLTASEFELIEKGRAAFKCKKCSSRRKSIIFPRRDSISSDTTPLGASGSSGQRDSSLEYNSASAKTSEILDIIKESQEEIKSSVLELKNMFLKLTEKVDTCTKIMESFETVDNKIEIINKNIQELSKNREISTIEEGKQNRKFSDILKNPVLIIKPKDNNQKPETTSIVIKQHFSRPADFKVSGMRPVKNGSSSVLISCKNDDSISKMSNEIKDKLGDDYEVSIPKKKVRQLKIFGLSKLYTKEEFCLILKEQNNSFGPDSKINIVYMKEQNRGCYVIMETDELTHNNLIIKGRVNIDWDVCRVYEHGNFMRCFNCQEYYHTAVFCKNPVKCGKCSGNHQSSECNNDTQKCVNCSEANRTLNKNLDEAHCAWEARCPVYQHNTEIGKNRSIFYI